LLQTPPLGYFSKEVEYCPAQLLENHSLTRISLVMEAHLIGKQENLILNAVVNLQSPLLIAIPPKISKKRKI